MGIRSNKREVSVKTVLMILLCACSPNKIENQPPPSRGVAQPPRPKMGLDRLSDAGVAVTQPMLCGSLATLVGDDSSGKMVAGTGLPHRTCTVQFASHAAVHNCVITGAKLVDANEWMMTVSVDHDGSQFSYTCK